MSLLLISRAAPNVLVRPQGKRRVGAAGEEEVEEAVKATHWQAIILLRGWGGDAHRHTDNHCPPPYLRIVYDDV